MSIWREGHYVRIGKTFAAHESTNHGKGEYVRYSTPVIHTNTVEGSFSIFKRGMKGVYLHRGEQHLHRYLAEFDFRYSNRAALGVDDTAHAITAPQGVVGKRLTYKLPDRANGPEA